MDEVDEVQQVGEEGEVRDVVGVGAVEEASGMLVEVKEAVKESVKRVRAQAAERGVVKPVFLSKAERQKLALERLQQRRADQQRERLRAQMSLKEFSRQGRRSRSRSRERARGRRGRGRGRGHGQRRSRSRSRERARGRRNGGGDGSESPTEEEMERYRQEEARRIREQRLGGAVRDVGKGKGKSRGRGKRRFMFDWKAEDDTTRGADLPQEDVALAFGRGFRGGVDRDEQERSQSHSFYRDLARDRGRDKVIWKLLDTERVRERREKQRVKEEERARRNRHWKEKPLQEMTARDWRIFREDFEITARGFRVPKPLRNWDEAGLLPGLRNAVRAAGYTDPSPIQRAAIPIGLQNRDVIGIAKTGSGKTAAFLLPMITYIASLPELTEEMAKDGPYAVVLAPTRELAQQISQECDKFAEPLGYRAVTVIGGLDIKEQALQLSRGAEILIGTPGRINECLRARFLVLNQCNYIVLDEADRMVNMGFGEQIDAVMNHMPTSNLAPETEDELAAYVPDPDADTASSSSSSSSSSSHHRRAFPRFRFRQTIMFSATMPPDVLKIARAYMRNPITVAIGEQQGEASDTVEQEVVYLSQGAKLSRLMSVLRDKTPPIIVFCNVQRECDRICKELNNKGFRAEVFHGGKSQPVRIATLQQFKDGRCDILVGTDVLGRGIDIDGITLVINYDLPREIDRYVHRIGRTGRAGQRGHAISFITSDDTHIMFDLVEMLKKTGASVPKELERHPSAQFKDGGGGGGRGGGRGGGGRRGPAAPMHFD